MLEPFEEMPPLFRGNVVALLPNRTQPASPAACPLRLWVFAWNTVAVETLKLFLKIVSTMNFSRLLTGWVLLTAALTGQRLFAAPPIETLARVHWSGLNQVSASSNSPRP